MSGVLNTGPVKLTIDSTGGTATISGPNPIVLATTSNSASAVTITSNGGTAEKIVITNTQGSAVDSIYLLSSVGGVKINAAGTTSITNNMTIGGTLDVSGNFSSKLIVTPITGNVTLGTSESGSIYPITQSSLSTITITLPIITVGIVYKFVIIGTGSQNVSIVTNGSSNYLYGTLIQASTFTPTLSIISSFSAKNTIALLGSLVVVGDYVELYALTTTHWHVRIVTSANSAVTTS